MKIVFLLLLLCGALPAIAQVGIGTTTPDTTAALDVGTTTACFLVLVLFIKY